jgi:hypothetical protein
MVFSIVKNVEHIDKIGLYHEGKTIWVIVLNIYTHKYSPNSNLKHAIMQLKEFKNV